MDPISQIAFGAVAGLAAGGKKAPRASVLAGGLAGLIPDLDVFIIIPSDPMSSILYHRHFTHALVMIPVIALLAWLPFLAFSRYRSVRLPLFYAALAGAATHGFLDATTSYGTMLLWPFTDARISWDIVPIIDPLFTLLIITLLIISVYKKWWKGGFVGLGLFTAFFLFGIVQHARAASALEQVMEMRGHNTNRQRVMPLPASMIVWNTVYEYEGLLYRDSFRAGPFSSVTWDEGTPVPHLTKEKLPQEIINEPDALRAFEIFNWFSDGYVSQIENDEFIVGDFRYFTDPESDKSLWGIRIGPEYKRHVDRVSFEMGEGRAGSLLQAIFSPGERYQHLP